MTNEEKILKLLTGLQSDMSGVKTDIAGLKTDMANLKTDVAGLQTNVAGIRMDIENRIDPQLQALAEGQKTTLEPLAPKNRVEALDAEVEFMKRLFKSLSRDVDELKKAN